MRREIKINSWKKIITDCVHDDIQYQNILLPALDVSNAAYYTWIVCILNILNRPFVAFGFCRNRIFFVRNLSTWFCPTRFCPSGIWLSTNLYIFHSLTGQFAHRHNNCFVSHTNMWTFAWRVYYNWYSIIFYQLILFSADNLKLKLVITIVCCPASFVLFANCCWRDFTS